MKIFARIVLVVCIFTLVNPAVVLGYTVAPLAFNLNLERRDIIHESITITNPSERQLRLYASVHEVSTSRDGVLESFAVPDNADRDTTPTSWIEISRARIVLEPGEQRDIPFTIRMNPYTEPGEYSVFIGFATGSNKPEAVEKILAGQTPGTLVNLTIDKKQNHFLRLESFLIDTFVTNPATEEISLRFQNPGEVATTPGGEIIFYDSKGREVTAVPLNQEAVRIDAADSATYSVPVPEDLPMGRYKAFLAAEYGDTMRANLNDTSFFYVVSIPQLAMLIFGLFLATLFIVYLWYRRNQHDDDSEVPLYVQTGHSPEQDHDLDLKKTYE